MARPKTSSTQIITYLFLSAWLMLTGCGGIPALSAFDPVQPPEMLENCQRIFPTRPAQFLHRIETRMPGGHLMVMLGLTQVTPHTRRLHAILMTPEHLVVFEGFAAESIQVQRSLPPFDTKAWAEGLFADIGLFLLAPQGERPITGLTAEGRQVCRYYPPDGRTIDIILENQRPQHIHEYDTHGNSVRRISLAYPAIDDFQTEMCYPSRLELNVSGYPSYTLNLMLLQMEPL